MIAKIDAGELGYIECAGSAGYWEIYLGDSPMGGWTLG